MENQNNDKAGVKSDLKEKGSGYIAAALGLVAGLAWNDAVKSLIDLLFPMDTSTVWPKFIYAVIITVVVIFVSRYILKNS